MCACRETMLCHFCNIFFCLVLLHFQPSMRIFFLCSKEGRSQCASQQSPLPCLRCTPRLSPKVVRGDGTTASLTSLKWRNEPTTVVKIAFKPDLAVAPLMLQSTILSKGARNKGSTRRGKRVGAQADDISMPDTEAQYMD